MLAEVDAAGRIERKTRKTLARTKLALVLARGAEIPNISSLVNFSKYLNRISSRIVRPQGRNATCDWIGRFCRTVWYRIEHFDARHLRPGFRIRCGNSGGGGKAEAGIALASEISTVAGAVNAGAIPPELQQTVSFDTFIPVDAPHPELAREFRSLFDTRTATDIMEMRGMSTT